MESQALTMLRVFLTAVALPPRGLVPSERLRLSTASGGNEREGSSGNGSNACSMPNESRESTVLRAIKLLISVLPRAERAALRPWLLARYSVDGTESAGLPARDARE